MSYIVERISERKLVECVLRRREFKSVDGRRRFSFPCDDAGNVDMKDKNYKYWKRNYENIINHPDEYIDLGVHEEKMLCVEHAIVKCSCGAELTLHGDTICCECGQYYNGFGQTLKDPEYWEEDWLSDDY